MDIVEIERSIIKKYRKELWSKFVKAVKKFDLINKGDKVCCAISGGKDSLLTAKLVEELYKHSNVKFEVEYLCMDPGYDEYNRNLLEENLKYLNINAHIYDSDVFEVSEKISENYPCYMCARMRRGFLYAKTKELGCNKIALGHHMNDTIETTLMNIFYSGNFKTMKPKLKAQNFDNMELIRPMYFIEEKDVIAWRDYVGLKALNCACTVTKKSESYTRKKIKNLIDDLKDNIPNLEKSILRSADNVNCDMVLGYSLNGKKYSFLEEFEQ